MMYLLKYDVNVLCIFGMSIKNLVDLSVLIVKVIQNMRIFWKVFVFIYGFKKILMFEISIIKVINLILQFYVENKVEKYVS